MSRSWIAFSSFVLTCLAQLPPYDGQYGVGSVTLELPVQNARGFGNETIASTGRPAFQLQTILVSIYYPSASKTNTSTKPSPPWLPQPLDLIVQGISAGTNGSVSPGLISVGLTAFAGGASIPAFIDVPIANASSSFPVFVFSHGDTSLPQWYSRYLGQIAADGNVVAAITHRDGSNAGSQVLLKGQPPQNVTFMTPQQLSPALNATGLRMLQRQFRQAEVDETIRILQTINAGQGGDVYLNSTRGEGETLVGWRDRLDFRTLVISGHSFGATSALDTLSTPNTTSYSVRAGLTLDPGKDSGPLATNISIPILIPQSEAWTAQPPFEFYGQSHFATVKSIAQSSLNASAAGFFMTLLGSAHVSLTDAGLIAGSAFLAFFDEGAKNATVQPATAIDRYVNISREFLRYLRTGQRTGVLASGITNPGFVPKFTPPIPGNESSYWEVHVAPPTNSSATGDSKSSGSVVVASKLRWTCLVALVGMALL